jgi:hypothetical protein
VLEFTALSPDTLLIMVVVARNECVSGVAIMAGQEMTQASGDFNFYGPQYSRFSSETALELRREVSKAGAPLRNRPR